jgi:hypothetical protein
MVHRLRGYGWPLLAAAASTLLLAGCGGAGGSRQRPTRVDHQVVVSAPAAAVRQVRQDFHSWSCSAMSLTSPTAIAADVAANVAGNQFGSGSGPSAEANFIPASATADGDPYAEFECEKDARQMIVWYEEIAGVWVPKNGGFATSGALSESPSTIAIPASNRENPNLIEEALQQDFLGVLAPAGKSFRPTCSLSDGRRSDYYCVVTNTSTHLNLIGLYHVNLTSGKVFHLEGGNSTSTQSTSVASDTGTATTEQSSTTAPDLYASCSNTVVTFAGIETDLRAYLAIANHGNTTALHDDFAALGDDLELMEQQAVGLRHYRASGTFENAAAIYLADAEEVDIAGQLVSQPSVFPAALRQSCPSSWYTAGLPGGHGGEATNATTSPTTSQGTPATPLHCSVPTFNRGLEVLGTSCSIAAEVVRDATKAPGCQVGDQSGSASSARCAVDGFDCQATLGYPPGQSQGEESPFFTCTEPPQAKVSWYSPV